jgi:hypothetical protein
MMTTIPLFRVVSSLKYCAAQARAHQAMLACLDLCAATPKHVDAILSLMSAADAAGSLRVMFDHQAIGDAS